MSKQVRRVLYVGHQEEFFQEISHYFASKGDVFFTYEITRALDGVHGLSYMTSHEVNLVIIDFCDNELPFESLMPFFITRSLCKTAPLPSWVSLIIKSKYDPMRDCFQWGLIICSSRDKIIARP